MISRIFINPNSYSLSSNIGIARSFASKMQASSTNNTKDSKGRALGLKKLGDQYVMPGDIIVRQRGFKWHPKHNVISGRDHTIHAAVEGIVHFEKRPDYFKRRTEVSVIPALLPNNVKYGSPPPLPYVYHPEQFPELAKNNPKPFIMKKREEIVKEKNYTYHAKKVERQGVAAKRNINTFPIELLANIATTDDGPNFKEQMVNRAFELEETLHGTENFEENTINIQATM